jgi:DNA-binding HxlR family transcriptional regulator
MARQPQASQPQVGQLQAGQPQAGQPQAGQPQASRLRAGRPRAGQVRECSIANALAVVGERWSLLALREVFFGVRRFDQIIQNTGASRDILATRLRKLVDAGLLSKQLYERHPPRHEYVLTEAGLALQGVLLTLMQWGDRHVTEGPPPTVWRHSCGATLVPRTVCGTCGEQVRPDSLDLVHTSQRTSAAPPAAGR